jgi:hypothetical protein
VRSPAWSAITPAAGFVGPLAAIAIGAGVSFCSYFAIRMKGRFGYDDTLDVFGVHCVGGIWGALATGLFASKAIKRRRAATACSPEAGPSCWASRVLGIAIALGYAAVVTLILGMILKAVIGLRAEPDQEDAAWILPSTARPVTREPPPAASRSREGTPPPIEPIPRGGGRAGTPCVARRRPAHSTHLQ